MDVTISAEEYLQTASVVYITRICQLTSAIIMLYDHVLTIDREVDFIWIRPRSYGSVTYLLIRYIGDALSILNIFAFLDPNAHTLNVRNIYFFSQAWLGLSILFLIQLMLQVRLYALYRGSKVIFAIMLFGFVGEIAALATMTCIIDTESKVTNQLLGGLNICVDLHIPAFYHVYVMWLPVIVYEGVLYLLAIWYGVGHWMSGYRIQRMDDRVSITDGLVTGNASYFFCVALGCIVSAVIGQHLEFKWTAMYRGYPATTQAMFGCRLILNLRMMISQDTETFYGEVDDDTPWVTAVPVGTLRPSSGVLA